MKPVKTGIAATLFWMCPDTFLCLRIGSRKHSAGTGSLVFVDGKHNDFPAHVGRAIPQLAGHVKVWEFSRCVQ